MKPHKKQFSILDRIKRATTEREINGLLEVGNSLVDASESTRHKWARHAMRRKAQLAK